MEIDDLLESYYTWLKNNTEIVHDKDSGWHAISTPFTGIFNDMIEIYIKIENEKILLSDDGNTTDNLDSIGVNLSRSSSRRKILDAILLNFGVKLEKGEIRCECNINDFPKRKHLFLQALIEINDMFMLSVQRIASVFKEDVEKYLDEIDVVVTKDLKFTGISGIDFNFDFVVAGKRQEKILRAVNYLNKTTLTTFLYAWGDVAPVRKKISKKDISAIAIINNENRPIKPEYLEALRIKDADYILWTERSHEDNIHKLKEAA